MFLDARWLRLVEAQERKEYRPFDPAVRELLNHQAAIVEARQLIVMGITGKILWHAGLMALPSAGPITYMLDGKQYLVVAAGDSLYSFTVNQPAN